MQLTVKEINEGKTLKGGPVSAGGLGALGMHASKPPVIGKEGTSLPVVSDATLR